MPRPALPRRTAGGALPGFAGTLLLLLAGAIAMPRLAEAQEIGSVTKLPLPRYVSLKSDKVNLREGPSREHRATWIFQRAGLPVEITAEFDTWRKIRDSEGSEGWVLHSLLSGRRTALVAPWKKGQTFNLYRSRDEQSSPIAALQTGVIGNIQTCDRTWCRIYGEGYDGYVLQANLWGVYPERDHTVETTRRGRRGRTGQARALSLTITSTRAISMPCGASGSRPTSICEPGMSTIVLDSSMRKW